MSEDNSANGWRRSVVHAVALVAAYLLWTALFATTSLHPFVVFLVLAVADSTINSKDAADRILLSAAATLGIVPVFGWVTLPAAVDPLAMILAVWIWAALRQARAFRPRDVGGVVDYLPAAGAAALTYRWWAGVPKGTPEAVLERLLPIWDHSAHFDFFLMNLWSGKFLSQTHSPGGSLAWQGVEYPTGAHYVWSRFALGSRELLLADTSRAIPVYAMSVVVSMAVTVFVVGIAMMRICTTRRTRFSAAALGGGLAAGAVALGPLSQSVYAGFANMPAVITGVAVVISLQARPLKNVTLQTVGLLAGSMTLLYNWYPTILLVLPLLVLHVVNLLKTRRWTLIMSLVVPASVLGILPVLQTFSLGISHLNINGGVQQLPSGLLLTVLLGTLAIGMNSLGAHRDVKAFLMCAPPSLFLLGLGLRLRLTTGSYPYYFHKASLFVLPVAMLAALAVLLSRIDHSERSNPARRLRVAALPASAVVMAFGLSQIFGYWGLDYPTFAGGGTAIGVLSRNDIVNGSSSYLPTAQTVISEAKETADLSFADRSCLTLIIPEMPGASLDASNLSSKNTLAGVWFHSLTLSYTVAAQSQAYMTSNVAHTLGVESVLADAVSKTFDPGSGCIFSTPTVTRFLRETRDDWKTRDFGN